MRRALTKDSSMTIKKAQIFDEEDVLVLGGSMRGGF
jgi:hypothetical protein